MLNEVAHVLSGIGVLLFGGGAGISGVYWNYRKWLEDQYKRIAELQAEAHGERLSGIRQTIGRLIEGGDLSRQGNCLDDDQNHGFFEVLRYFQRAYALYMSFPWWAGPRRFLLRAIEPEIRIYHGYLDGSADWKDKREEPFNCQQSRSGLDALYKALSRAPEPRRG
ncbi:hypothetical protein ABIA39_008909 [Nocardia sp. GAS34]|uniref:hypothetical protein n=1 Tax=unclassified Nocardia TaxID=2637762 RepID=UPI003D256E53